MKQTKAATYAHLKQTGLGCACPFHLRLVAAARQPDQVAELGILAEQLAQALMHTRAVEPGLDEGARGLPRRGLEAVHGPSGRVSPSDAGPPRLDDPLPH